MAGRPLSLCPSKTTDYIDPYETHMNQTWYTDLFPNTFSLPNHSFQSFSVFLHYVIYFFQQTKPFSSEIRPSTTFSGQDSVGNDHMVLDTLLVSAQKGPLQMSTSNFINSRKSTSFLMNSLTISGHIKHLHTQTKLCSCIQTPYERVCLSLTKICVQFWVIDLHQFLYLGQLFLHASLVHLKVLALKQQQATEKHPPSLAVAIQVLMLFQTASFSLLKTDYCHNTWKRTQSKNAALNSTEPLSFLCILPKSWRMRLQP